jgi:hypothetical protein
VLTINWKSLTPASTAKNFVKKARDFSNKNNLVKDVMEGCKLNS